jgi:hypothetical protein
MHRECARLRHPLSNHPTRRTPWRKARCAATRKRRNRSRTRTSRKAPPPPRRSPACTARRTRTRTARSRKPARRAAANTLPCRGRVDARSASGWGCVPRDTQSRFTRRLQAATAVSEVSLGFVPALNFCASHGRLILPTAVEDCGCDLST